ncbi:hypothetical protein UFOVP115_77 [uncultured Caudovirales phage]|uniref:Uncharacterized protein n=1 Tax=uncultured Caudovirales phage TaxID=2100421 RepID=A0A6J5L9G6_9CAUD|nr:hypothetical protein UFOVP115_77 [uncultured Caudovirales phage]
MPNTADGKYGYRAWDKPVGVPKEAAYPPQEYVGPFASNSERMLSQSFAINSMSAEEIKQYVRPPLPQVKLFPNKFGYETHEYGIKDIVEMTGRAVQRSDFSQQATTTESTSRNALGNT